MSFSRYLKYKASGLGWLGDVPEHWTAIRYKNIFAEKQKVPGALLPPGSISFGRVVFKSDSNLNELTKATYQEVLAGEFLINPINLNYDLKSFRTGFSEINTCVSPAYIVLRAKTTSNRKYLKYQLHLFDVAHMKTLGAGVRQTITFEDIGSCLTYLPPLPEQSAIAEFLDCETAKINRLVEEQERLVELLKEKRQAVISHAVTKGQNPRAPMKPSGVEWLGDVPAHWEVGPLKRFWNTIDCKHITPEFIEEGIPLVSIREVQGRWIALERARRTTERFYELLIGEGRLPESGDLIFSRNATVGEVAQVPAEHPRFAMGQDVVLLRRRQAGCSPDFLQHVIRSPIVTQQIDVMMIGSTFKRINVEEIRSLKIPWPPLDEQGEIAKHLELEAERFESLAAEAERAINLLQERRAALISAAVTGQIDVRQAVEKVPA